MAEYDYDGDGSTFPTPKANTNGSGSATFWDNSFKKLVDRTRWLKDNLTAAAATVAGYSGASFTIASGTVETFLRLLADKAAKLDATVNAFTGKMQIGASATDPGAVGLGIEGGLTVGGASTLGVVTASLVTPNALKITQTFERSQWTPSASAATLTWSVTDGPVIWLDAHTVPCTLTLADPPTSSAKRYEVDIFWAPTTSTDDLTVRNAATSIIGGLGDSGWIRFRWDGTAWRGFGGVNFDGGVFLQAP